MTLKSTLTYWMGETGYIKLVERGPGSDILYLGTLFIANLVIICTITTLCATCQLHNVKHGA